MLRFVARRLLQVLPTLLLLSLLVFAWLRSLPGGPASAFLGDRATPERIAEYNRLIGLDQPLYVQYFKFLGRVLTGDFGTSTKTSQPVLAEIGRALPATIELSVVALLVAVLLGIPLGYLAPSRCASSATCSRRCSRSGWAGSRRRVGRRWTSTPPT